MSSTLPHPKSAKHYQESRRESFPMLSGVLLPRSSIKSFSPAESTRQRVHTEPRQCMQVFSRTVEALQRIAKFARALAMAGRCQSKIAVSYVGLVSTRAGRVSCVGVHQKTHCCFCRLKLRSLKCLLILPCLNTSVDEILLLTSLAPLH